MLGRRYRSILAAIVKGGNKLVIRLLLEYSVDINTRLKGIYLSALATVVVR
jgi:hypothetical protein